MFVQLGCNNCNSELKIPIMIGGMYPNMESICKKCENVCYWLKPFIKILRQPLAAPLKIKLELLKKTTLSTEEIKDLIKNGSPVE